MSVRGKKILILGDSLSTGASSPGGVFGAQLRAAGAVVRVNGRVSRSAVNFWSGANGENGAAVVAAEAAHKPDIVIVVLGTNDLGLNASADQKAFGRIAASFPNAELWAVGPPSFAKLELSRQAPQVYATLAAVFGGVRVIDWQRLTADIVAPEQGRARDGVHFATNGAAAAGKRLAEAWLAARARDGRASAMPTLNMSWRFPVAAVAVAATAVGVAWVVRRRRQLGAPLGVVRVDRLPQDDPDRGAYLKQTADRVNAAAAALDRRGQSHGAFTKKVYLADVAKEVGLPLSRLAPLLLLFRKRGWIDLQRRDLAFGHDAALVAASTIEYQGNQVNMLVVS